MTTRDVKNEAGEQVARDWEEARSIVGGVTNPVVVATDARMLQRERHAAAKRAP